MSSHERGSSAGGRRRDSHAGAGPSRVLWRTDFEKDVVTGSFERMGWMRWADTGAGGGLDGDGRWNVYWANVNTTKQIQVPYVDSLS